MHIREIQLAAFQERAANSFEGSLADDIFDFSKGHPGISDASQTDALAHAAISRAKARGLTHRGAVRLYAQLMVLLGSDFDTDPLLPWAPYILTRQEDCDARSRAEQLYFEATRYLNEVAGSGDVHLIRTFESLVDGEVRPAVLARYAPEANLAHELYELYPFKCRAAGEGRIAMFGDAAKQICYLLEKREPISSGAVTLMMFLFGHKVLDDPLHVRVSTLLRENITGCQELTGEIQIYLKQWADYLASRVTHG